MIGVERRQHHRPSVRHDQMAGRTPTTKDHELGDLIEQLLRAPGVVEVSRTQVSAFLWYNRCYS
jgi:hypothetical protein